MNKAAINRWFKANPRTRRAVCVLLIPLFVVFWLMYVCSEAYHLAHEIAGEWRRDFWG